MFGLIKLTIVAGLSAISVSASTYGIVRLRAHPSALYWGAAWIAAGITSVFIAYEAQPWALFGVRELGGAAFAALLLCGALARTEYRAERFAWLILIVTAGQCLMLGLLGFEAARWFGGITHSLMIAAGGVVLIEVGRPGEAPKLVARVLGYTFVLIGMLVFLQALEVRGSTESVIRVAVIGYLSLAAGMMQLYLGFEEDELTVGTTPSESGATRDHDVRNYLMSVMGNAELLTHSKDSLPDDVLKGLAQIQSAAAEATRLMSSDPNDPAQTQCSTSKAVTRAIQLTRPLMPEGISLKYSGRSRNAEVAMSEGDVLRVLSNVFINAIQAIDARTQRLDHAEIQVEIRVLSQYVEVLVTDNGEGMSAQTRARVFEPSFTTRRQGTGLGLPGSLELLKRHGGEITIQSLPGAGSQVSIVLPRSVRNLSAG